MKTDAAGLPFPKRGGKHKRKIIATGIKNPYLMCRTFSTMGINQCMICNASAVL